MSLRNRLRAVIRCVRPRSSMSHSAAGDDAREQVVRKDALGALVAAVDGEGDALVEEGEVRLLLAALQLLGRRASAALEQRAVVAARLRPARRTSRRRRPRGRSRRTDAGADCVGTGLPSHQRSNAYATVEPDSSDPGDARPRASPVRAGAPLRTRSPAAARRRAGATAPTTRGSGSDPDPTRQAAGSASTVRRRCL